MLDDRVRALNLRWCDHGGDRLHLQGFRIHGRRGVGEYVRVDDLRHHGARRGEVERPSLGERLGRRSRLVGRGRLVVQQLYRNQHLLDHGSEAREEDQRGDHAEVQQRRERAGHERTLRALRLVEPDGEGEGGSLAAGGRRKDRGNTPRPAGPAAGGRLPVVSRHQGARSLPRTRNRPAYPGGVFPYAQR